MKYSLWNRLYCLALICVDFKISMFSGVYSQMLITICTCTHISVNEHKCFRIKFVFGLEKVLYKKPI